MKKTILSLILMCVTLGVNAQNYKKDGKPYPFYCQLLGQTNLIGQLRLTIMWDNQPMENHLRDENGKKIEFNSMTHAMNYMAKRGWEYVDCVTYSEAGKPTVHYIFKKYVVNDEEAKEGLRFKSDL